MKESTFIRRREEMVRTTAVESHGGKGVLDWTKVIASDETKDKHLRFFFDLVLPPGVSIGIHKHENDEEYYYIISGAGIITLDGEQLEVGPGDVTAAFTGGTHGLANDSERDLRVLVIGVS